MENSKTPGVKVEEISLLPPSVEEAATAIPAFIGYTQIKPAAVELNQPVRINTMLDYTTLFGGAMPRSYTANEAGIVTPVVMEDNKKFLLYYAMKLYFTNGGGNCWIVPVGHYDDALLYDHFKAGLDALEKEEEPTLIVFPDAINLTSGYSQLCIDTLAQCNKMKNRFGVFDVLEGDGDGISEEYGKTFRQNITSPFLKYGAAYIPFLNTLIAYEYEEGDEDNKSSVEVSLANEMRVLPLFALADRHRDLYNKIKVALSRQRVVLPPSPAIVGIYAQVDRFRGVWGTPANVNVSGISGPTKMLTNAQQELLNIDATSGKSINVIRHFTGKGTLVWGARTLAGNDKEWRYISVRRLLIMIEVAIQKATAFVVFEANDQTTWSKVQSMIDNFLFGLWQHVALAGPSPESAYFINVGLGKTMTTDDILNGRMIIEVGVAAVRPAEFIILRFSHNGLRPI